jgi:hypothetical protein
MGLAKPEIFAGAFGPVRIFLNSSAQIMDSIRELSKSSRCFPLVFLPLSTCHGSGDPYGGARKPDPPKQAFFSFSACRSPYLKIPGKGTLLLAAFSSGVKSRFFFKLSRVLHELVRVLARPGTPSPRLSVGECRWENIRLSNPPHHPDPDAAGKTVSQTSPIRPRIHLFRSCRLCKNPVNRPVSVRVENTSDLGPVWRNTPAFDARERVTMPLQQREILPHPITLATPGSAKRNALKTPAQNRYFSDVKLGVVREIWAKPAGMGDQGGAQEPCLPFISG